MFLLSVLLLAIGLPISSLFHLVIAQPPPVLSVTPTQTLTLAPALTPMLSPSPTLTRIKLIATPTLAAKPKPPVLPPNTLLSSSVREYLMNEINNYRRSQGLSNVATDLNTCGFATIRAKELSSGFNHEGFSTRMNNHSLPYPSFSTVIENIAMNSDYKEVVKSWISSSAHATNMRADTPFVCVVQNENYFAYEGWKP